MHILDTLYHEMTHALLWLQEFYDAEIQKLYSDGVAAYAGARGVDGTLFDGRRHSGKPRRTTSVTG